MGSKPYEQMDDLGWKKKKLFLDLHPHQLVEGVFIFGMHSRLWNEI